MESGDAADELTLTWLVDISRSYAAGRPQAISLASPLVSVLEAPCGVAQRDLGCARLRGRRRSSGAPLRRRAGRGGRPQRPSHPAAARGGAWVCASTATPRSTASSSAAKLRMSPDGMRGMDMGLVDPVAPGTGVMGELIWRFLPENVCTRSGPWAASRLDSLTVIDVLPQNFRSRPRWQNDCAAREALARARSDRRGGSAQALRILTGCPGGAPRATCSRLRAGPLGRKDGTTDRGDMFTIAKRLSGFTAATALGREQCATCSRAIHLSVPSITRAGEWKQSESAQSGRPRQRCWRPGRSTGSPGIPACETG